LTADRTTGADQQTVMSSMPRGTVVPGTFVSSDALVSHGWPAGGGSLVA
jgi:hypothetical protein